MALVNGTPWWYNKVTIFNNDRVHYYICICRILVPRFIRDLVFRADSHTQLYVHGSGYEICFSLAAALRSFVVKGQRILIMHVIIL